MKTSAPIGVFDSGIGGLTVVQALWKRLPAERIYYFGDTARVPYGSKSPDAVRRFSLQIGGFLLRQKIKMLIVACNTASAWALDALKRRIPVPVLGVIEPGAAEALRRTRAGRIGVIGTQGTIASRGYERALRAIWGKRAASQGTGRRLHVFSAPCPLFVPLAEEGWTDGKIAREVARRYLDPLIRARVDTLLLGCTHYPILAGVVRGVMGPGVEVVDSASAVAAAAEAVLIEKRMAASVSARRLAGANRHRFFVSDQPLKMQEMGRRFLGRPLGKVRKVDLDHV